MARNSNLFFFRETYTRKEKEERIGVKVFRQEGYSPVDSVLAEASLSREILDGRKEDFLQNFRAKLSKRRYATFISEVFEDYGERGDRLNTLFWKSEPLSYESILSVINEETEKEVEADGGDSTNDYAEKISDHKVSEPNIIDIEFLLSNTGDVTDISGGKLRDSAGNSVDVSEVDPDQLGLQDLDQHASSSKQTVEVRAYCDYGLVAVSNSDCPDAMQEELFETVCKWGDTSPADGELVLRDTELLMIQSLMDGRNSGLDYGGFTARNLTTAKYRGKQTESLRSSPVLDPARERGEVTQTRFYYDYDDGNGEREVQVRLHRDGHVTTSTPVCPDFVSDLRKHIESTLERREYLVSLNRQMNKYAPVKGQRELQFEEGTYRRDVDVAFGKLISNYRMGKKHDDTVQVVYKSAIANIGIKLIKADLDDSSYPDPDPAPEQPDDKVHFQEFFDDYSDFELAGIRTDFDELWNHLYYILSKNRMNTPIELIDQVKNEYAFDS